jgi:hypothetical protein
MEQIDQQIDALPKRYVFYTRKEIRYLPKIMNEGERVLALTSGYIDARTWLLVCTTHRVLFLHRGMFWGLHQLQMTLDRVQSIDSSFGLIFGTIRMWDGASSMHVSLILRRSVAPFVRTVQEAIDRYKRQIVHDIATNVTRGQAPHAGSPQPAWIAELEKLSKMKVDGVLSEAEFTAAKTKLLNHQ